MQEIEKKIKQFGIKKSHLAKRVNITPAELSHYLSGRREIPLEVKIRINDYLKIKG